jgi:hypothetical protein
MKRNRIEEYIAVLLLAALMFGIGFSKARKLDEGKLKVACTSPPYLISIEGKVYYCRDYTKISRKEYGK